MITRRRTMAACAFVAVSVTSATAVAAQGGSLRGCRQISDPSSRLACYDALADDEIETTADRQRRQFGLAEQQKAPEERKEAQEVTAAVVSASGSQVSLDNGMTWRVVDNARAVGWVRPGQRATITRGVLSGYRMRVEGVNGVMVVSRVR